MRVIVTGGAGFIGSCMIHKLNERGINDIIVVDHLDETLKWKNLVGKSIEDYIAKEKFLDALESAKLKAPFDFIVHMGACSSTTETDGEYLMENNYIYSKRLAKWALAKNVPFLYASSAATYGDGSLGYSDEDEVSLSLRPLNLYGYSKQLFDLWLIRNGLTSKVTGFKFFNVFGPNEYHKDNMRSVIAKVFDGVSRGEKMRLFRSYVEQYPDGEQKRDFVYVKDAVDIVYYFMEHPDKKGIFNVGTGKARSWNDLARGIFAAVGRPAQIEYIDMPEQIRDKYQYFTQADLSKLRNAGYSKQFRSLEESISDYAGYLKNNSYL